jgi:hypothetical protein
MPFATAGIVDLLKLLLTNTTWAGVGDVTGIVGSTAAGSWFLSLHTSTPGAGGDQTSNEISYTGYARVAVARTSGGWTVTANPATLTSTVSWPQMTAGAGGTATFVGLGKSSTGAGELVLFGAISPTIPVSNGVTPQLTPSTTVTFT